MKAGAKFRFIILYACLKRQDLQQDMGIGKTHTSAHPNGTRMMMMMLVVLVVVVVMVVVVVEWWSGGGVVVEWW